MDALPQAVTDAWLTGVASNPILGAAAMLLLVLATNWVRHMFPALLPGGGGTAKVAAHEPEPSRLAATLHEAQESVEQIADALRARTEIARREVEAVERIERLLIEILARDKAARREASPPRPRPAGV